LKLGIYTLRRVAAAVLLLWAVATLVFLFLHVLPGDPVLIILGGEGGGQGPDPAQVEAVRRLLGLNRPVIVQYRDWMIRLVRCDLGRSLYDGSRVSARIAERAPATFELVSTAMGMAVVIGISLGLLAAVSHGSWGDVVLSGVIATGLSVPVFVTGTLAVLIFGVFLRWVPIGQYLAFTQHPLGHLRQLALPALTLSTGLAGVIGGMTRASVLDALHRDYVRTARSKGLSEGRVLVRHVLRAALIPIITVIGVQFGTLIGGTVLVEYIFDWPGLSTLLFSAIQRRDYPTVQGVVLFVSAVFILVNLIVDLSYAFLDPRARYGEIE
jgi:peptide/nickel transport system permease protein